MNIDELKTAWNQYDENLESNINLKLLKSASLNKTYSMTGNFRFHAIVEALINAYFVNWTAKIAWDHFYIWEYSVPAIVIGLCSLFTVIWNVRSLVQISRLKYDENIAEAQRTLERINLQWDWRKNALYYLIFPVVTAMLAIMGLKFLNLDLSVHFDILLYAIIAGIIVIPFVIWINKKFRDKGMESAVNFLKEIKKFEEEGAV